MLQNLRLAMRRQIRRHSTRRSTFSSSRRRLGRLWSRLFRSGARTRGHASLVDPPGPTQITLGLHSYQTVEERGLEDRAIMAAGLEDEVGEGGLPSSCCSAAVDLQPSPPESPGSPLSLHSNSPEEEELSPAGREDTRAPPSGPPTPSQSDSAGINTLPNPQSASAPPCHRRPSRKLVLELAVNLKGVSLRRYSPLGPLSPVSPSVFPSSSQTQSNQLPPHGSEVTSPTELTPSSVKAQGSDSHFTLDVPSGEVRSRDGRKRKRKSRFGKLSKSPSEEGGDSKREATC